MSDLIVLAFDSEGGALQLRDKLLDLQKQHLISLEDAAVVIRRQDGKVKVNEVSLDKRDAVGFIGTDNLSIEVLEDSNVLIIDVPNIY